MKCEGLRRACSKDATRMTKAGAFCDICWESEVRRARQRLIDLDTPDSERWARETVDEMMNELTRSLT